MGAVGSLYRHAEHNDVLLTLKQTPSVFRPQPIKTHTTLFIGPGYRVGYISRRQIPIF